MDVEKNAAAAGAEATRKEQIVKLHKKVWMYSFFLYIASVTVVIAPRLAPASRPAFVPSIPSGYGSLVTCVVFGVATLVVQEMLARVLERSPAPTAPRLIPEAAWSLGIATCMFLDMFFRSYLCFGGDRYFVRGCDEYAMACGAFLYNLLIATFTVTDYLA